jgi:Uma2 family endonuclease
MVRALSVEDYLEFERTSVVRHEYVDGLVIEMPGETYRHNDLVGDIYIALKPQAKALGCQIAIESLKTPTRTTRYRYPDIVVSCQAGSDERFVENPCFIAEVTSESTAEVDHGAKLEEYTHLPSLQAYAIVAQTQRQVVLYERGQDGWTFRVLQGDGEFEVRCLQTRLSLQQIYGERLI